MITNHDIMISNSVVFFFNNSYQNKMTIQLNFYEESNVSIQLPWIVWIKCKPLCV